MEEKKLHCLKCGGAMTVTEKQSITTCSDCDALNPLPQGIFQQNRKNVEWLLERYNKAIEYLMSYQFHKAYNIYDKITKTTPDGYAYWGKVIAQYGAIYHIDQNLANQLVVLRTPWERIVDNENYQKALSLLDSQAGALIKNEGVEIERLCQQNRQNLMQTVPMDVTIIVNDDETNPKYQQDLELAEVISQVLEVDNISVKYLKGIWQKQVIDVLEQTLLPCLELSAVMIVVDSSDAEHENQLLKNTWIRYQSLMKSKVTENLLMISVGNDAIAQTNTLNSYFFPDLNDDNITKIRELINDTIEKINNPIEPLDEAITALKNKLLSKQFDQVKNDLKQLLNQRQDDYQLWWLSFLTKHLATSDEELLPKGISCEKDYYFQKAYALAPIKVRKYYQILLTKCRATVVPTPDQVYEQKLAESQEQLYHYHRKRLWKPFILYWVLTFIAFATVSLKSRVSFLVSFVVFTACFIYIVVECYRVNKLGKIPKTITGEVAINKYYQHLKINLPPSQSAAYLPYQPYKRLNNRWRILLFISLSFFFLFVVKEVVIAIDNWNMQYTYVFNKVIITGGTGEEIVIPSQIGNRKVYRVASRAFYDDDKIRGVFIEDGVEELGSQAFASCKNLQMIQLPKSLNKVGEQAPFKGCNESVHLKYPGKLYLSELFGVGYDEAIPGLNFYRGED